MDVSRETEENVSRIHDEVCRSNRIVVVHDQFIVIELSLGVWLTQNLPNQKRMSPDTLNVNYKDAPNGTRQEVL